MATVPSVRKMKMIKACDYILTGKYKFETIFIFLTLKKQKYVYLIEKLRFFNYIGLNSRWKSDTISNLMLEDFKQLLRMFLRNKILVKLSQTLF